MSSGASVDNLWTWRQAPIWELGPTTFPVRYGRAIIARLLPHKADILQLDTITHVDVRQGRIRAQRRIDPVDAQLGLRSAERGGILPVLMLEMIVQSAECLAYFCEAGRPAVETSPTPKPRRSDGLVVHRAGFAGAVSAGDAVTVVARRLDLQHATHCYVGQVLLRDEVRSFSVIEFAD